MKILCQLGIIFIGFILTLSVNTAQAQTCSAVYAPKNLDERVIQFTQKYADRSRSMKKVSVKFSESKAHADFEGASDILILSVKNIDYQRQAQIRDDVLEMMGPRSISFSMKLGEEHLYSRYQSSLFDYDYRWGHGLGGDKPEAWKIFLFKNDYRPVAKAMQFQKVIEPVISLSDAEMSRLDEFMTAAQKDIVATVGRFKFEGTLYNSGSLAANVPPEGEGNNCTSWLMNAPIMDGQQSFLSGLGPHDPFVGYIATNPGWLLAYILTKSNPQRVPLKILWTTQSLEEAVKEIENKGLTDWNFNPH